MSDISINSPKNQTLSLRWLLSWRIWLITLFLITCAGWSYLAYAISSFAEQDQTRPADAAVVLGAGVWRGRPSPVFRERINHGIKLYNEGYVDTLIFTGGIGNRDERSEAAVAREYAIAQGIPASAILIEETSTSTIENLRNAQAVAQTAEDIKIETYLLVSTPYHMLRATHIAADLGMDAHSSPTQTIRWRSNLTRNRALIQETISYTLYLINGIE